MLSPASDRASVPAPGWASREAGRVIVLDNLDSFTYSLAQMLRVLGCEVEVCRGDLPSDASSASLIVLSPGPGRPTDHAGLMRAVNLRPAPLFGVCLGMQAIALAAGARVVQGRPVHGRTSAIQHDGTDIFRGLPSPFRATRYHSLQCRDLPPDLELLATTRSGVAMALRHRFLPAWGVQFHPESVRTREGLALLRNVLTRAARQPPGVQKLSYP